MKQIDINKWCNKHLYYQVRNVKWKDIKEINKTLRRLNLLYNKQFIKSYYAWKYWFTELLKAKKGDLYVIKHSIMFPVSYERLVEMLTVGTFPNTDKLIDYYAKYFYPKHKNIKNITNREWFKIIIWLNADKNKKNLWLLLKYLENKNETVVLLRKYNEVCEFLAKTDVKNINEFSALFENYSKIEEILL